MSTKLTEALNWQSLEARYYIGSFTAPDGSVMHVNKLADAINNGDLMKLFEECANTTVFDGNLYEVFKQFSRNLSSMKTNLTKTDKFSGLDEKRWNMLREYTTTWMSKLNGHTKSKWQYSKEEVDALGNDFKALDGVYQCMMSKKSTNPEVATKDYLNLLDYVSDKRSMASKTQKLELSPTLMTKLAKGKAVTLSAAEIAELLKNLGK